VLIRTIEWYEGLHNKIKSISWTHQNEEKDWVRKYEIKSGSHVNLMNKILQLKGTLDLTSNALQDDYYKKSITNVHSHPWSTRSAYLITDKFVGYYTASIPQNVLEVE